MGLTHTLAIILVIDVTVIAILMLLAFVLGRPLRP
jgi:hypothetical protein